MNRAFRGVAWLLLGAALLAGLYGRGHRLGGRPLAVDEYYFVRSAEFILDSGVPAYPTGGYYVRGLLPQYATAASIVLFGPGELSDRLQSVAFSLASVALAFVYARRFVGTGVAACVAATLLLSSWQVEFARFARMYPAFQFMTLLFIIAVDRAFFEHERRWRHAPYALACLAVLTHELGILLTPLLFLPLLTTRAERRGPLGARLGPFLAAAATTTACLLFQQIDLRNWGVTDRFPPGYDPHAGSASPPLRLPDFPFWRVSEDPLINLAAFGLLLLLATGVLLIWQRRSGSSEAGVLAALLLICALAHAFVPAGLLLVVLVFRCRIHVRRLHSRGTYVLLSAAGAAAAAWLLAAVLLPGSFGGAPDGPSLKELVRRAFFGWPDFYRPLLLPWMRELPLLTVALCASIAHQAAVRLGGPLREALRAPAAVIVYMAICFGVLESPTTETRYTFFLYPVVLSAIAVSLTELCQGLATRGRFGPGFRPRVAAAIAYLVLFACSSDFNPRHLRDVATQEVSFRLGRYQRFVELWYHRLDFESPATYLEREGGPSDRIIVLGLPPVSHYLEREHAVYHDRDDDPRFRNVSRERGTVELWSGRRLLSSAEELRDYARDARTVWIVGTSGSLAPLASSIWPDHARSRPAFQSIDRRLEVARIDLD